MASWYTMAGAPDRQSRGPEGREGAEAAPPKARRAKEAAPRAPKARGRGRGATLSWRPLVAAAVCLVVLYALLRALGPVRCTQGPFATCPKGLRCVAGSCLSSAVSCLSSAHCRQGYRCGGDGTCVPQACQVDLDCDRLFPQGHRCFDGECRPQPAGTPCLWDSRVEDWKQRDLPPSQSYLGCDRGLVCSKWDGVCSDMTGEPGAHCRSSAYDCGANAQHCWGVDLGNPDAKTCHSETAPWGAWCTKLGQKTECSQDTKYGEMYCQPAWQGQQNWPFLMCLANDGASPNGFPIAPS